jgi:GTP-binding protein
MEVQAALSFRREKYIPFGGPDGGDGGDGGSIVIKGTDTLNTLADFKNKSLFKAENGKSGGSKNKHGRNGEDLIINLPLGCVIYDNETDEELFDLDDEIKSFTIVRGVNMELEMFVSKHQLIELQEKKLMVKKANTKK